MQNEQEVAQAIEVAVAPAEKKKPGRPKKKIATAPIEVHGIVEHPVNPGDIAELVYCNPTMFKKLLMLYKQFEVSEIEMNFDKAGLKILTKDHLGKSTIYTTIDGRCMNLYYCESSVRICIKRSTLESILGTIGKTQYKITFILKENYRSAMYMIVQDLEYSREDSYEIDVIFKPEDPARAALPADDDTNYPIKFKLSSKHFKSLVNNVRKLSPIITLQKAGTDHLQFTFARAKNVNWTGVYNDGAKIELQSNIEEDEVFSVSVHIDYIKPFSNSNIGDDVYIAAHQTEKISFMTLLDKKDIGYSTSVKIFTDIKDYRRAPINNQ